MAAITLRGMLDQDAARRRVKAAEAAADQQRRRLILVQNQVTQVLGMLDDPKDALLVTERIGRSIREYLAVRPRGGW
jgi:hypothetical protein